MPMTTFGPKTYGNDESEFAWSDMSGLLNLRSTPQQLADNELSQALNVYGRVDGGVTVRKGMSLHGAQFAVAPSLGGVRFFQQVVKNVPQTPLLKRSLGQSGGTIFDIDTNATVGAAGALGAAAQPWSVAIVMDPDSGSTGAPATPVPTTTAGAGGTIAANTYSIQVTYVTAYGESLPSATAIITTTGTTSTISVPSPPAIAGATGYNVYIAPIGLTPVLQNAVPVAIGTAFTAVSVVVFQRYAPVTDGSGSTTDSLVICTGSGGPYLFDGTNITVPAAWQQVAGARYCAVVNGVLWFGSIPSQPNLVWGSKVGHPQQLPFYGVFSLSGPVMGLAVVGDGPQSGLCVGLNRGITVIYGTGPSNFYVQDVPMSDGVVAGRTMITVSGSVYFLGRSAIYMFDGQSVARLSDKVEPIILNDPIVASDFLMGGPRATAFAWFYQNRIHFSYDSSGIGYPTTILVWDIILKGWTIVQPGIPIYAAFLIEAPFDAAPATCIVMGATSSQAYNWDVYNGLGTNGHNIDDAGVAIEAVVLSKYFKIGMPGVVKRLQRCYPEIFCESFSGQFTVNADYGAVSTAAVFTVATTGNFLVWDAGKWDASNWAGGFQRFINPRIDVEETTDAEAFAFGILSSPMDPPLTWQGVSGQYVQQNRQ